MDIKDIQNLIKFVSKAEVAEVSIKQEDIEIKIKTLHSVNQSIIPQQQYYVAPPAQQTINTQTAINANDATSTSGESIVAKEEEIVNDNLITVKSPMIGTFYRATGPGKDPFVSVGDSIIEGKVICIVEAMKLFNEIESEVSGKIIKILVEDATPVEYDQPLFLVDPA